MPCREMPVQPHRLTEPHVKPAPTGIQVEETPREKRLARYIACALIVKIITIVVIWIRFYPS